MNIRSLDIVGCSRFQYDVISKRSIVGMKGGLASDMLRIMQDQRYLVRSHVMVYFE